MADHMERWKETERHNSHLTQQDLEVQANM